MSKYFQPNFAGQELWQRYDVTVGDRSLFVVPGKLSRIEVLPVGVFRLRRLWLAQDSEHGGGVVCQWPIVHCGVGTRFLAEPMQLYNGLEEPIECRPGNRIKLVMRNPLDVPASVYGVLHGERLVRRTPAPPASKVEFEQLIRDAAAPEKIKATTPSVDAQPPYRVVTYCEAAPPRAVVEAASLVFSARMKLAWERHEAHERRWKDAAEAAGGRGDYLACAYAFRQYYAPVDRDVKHPTTPDAYGGMVVQTSAPDVGLFGFRCRLCGAWLRSVRVAQ